MVKILTEISDYPMGHINKLGWTALLEAITLGNNGEAHVGLVKILVAAGADVNIPDRDGITPLGHAKNKSIDKIVKILQKANTGP